MYKFIIIAHKGLEGDRYLEVTEIIVNAKDEQEALAHAKKLHKASEYVVKRIESLEVDHQEQLKEVIKAIKETEHDPLEKKEKSATFARWLHY